MKATIFDVEVATRVENAVMELYSCKRCEIVQFIDSDVKKVVVFILFHFMKYDWHMIGKAYQMTYLYVPTVAEELAYHYKNDELFKEKVDLIILKTKNHEAYLEAV